MGEKTPLYDLHVAAGARMVDFGGWDMPIHYGSQVHEHHVVRTAVGMCDVSHMTVSDITGAGAEAYLQYLLSNDVARLKSVGQALYTGMLDEAGGVIDDLIVYRLEQGFRLVTNCATREKDLAWMQQHIASFDCVLEEKPALAIIAVQGPDTFEVMNKLVPNADDLDGLGAFEARMLGSWFVAQTGYTGELGVEVILPDIEAPGLWRQLTAMGCEPVGLGARDTL